MEEDLERLQRDYPEYFNNGQTYAESWLRTLLKMEKSGLLKQIVGIESLPLPGEKDRIKGFIDKHAATVAQRQCIQDLKERRYSDVEGHARAFTAAFASKLSILLENRLAN